MKDFLSIRYCKYLIVFILVIFFSLTTASTNRSVRIGFEGMPGAGKTTSLTNIVKYLPSYCIFLPEINLQSNCIDRNYHVRDIYHQLWEERNIVLLSSGVTYSFIMDRTYFSNLAYSYAIDDTKEYNMTTDKVREALSNLNFDLIVILIASPEIGLKRRRANNDNPQYPWNNIEFLRKLKKFYIEEFPNVYQGKYVYINTDNMTLEVLEEKIREILSLYIKLDFTNVIPSVRNESVLRNKMLLFGKTQELGRPYTDIIDVLGYPTIYYRQHAIQNDGDGGVVYFDTNRLKQILLDSLL